MFQFYFRTILRDASSNPARANEFFVGRLQCQNNMKLVFRISEDGSEIELKYCASSKTSVKSSRKYFVSIGNRNKKPILNDIIYIFCNLKKP